MTEGKVSIILLRFAVPFLLASLVTALYNAIGLLVVGRYTSPEIIVAVATGSQLMNPMIAFMTGIGTGITVLIGMCIGEKDSISGTKATGSAFIVSAAVIVLITLFIWVSRETLLNLLGTPPESRESASRFVKISTMGVPFNVGYAMIAAIFRGVGNSKVPSIVAGISCLINIALSFLFVGAAGMAEDGIAYAVVAAQATSFVLVAIWLYKKKLPFPFSSKDIKPDSDAIKHITIVGLPIVLQDLAMMVAFMIITNRVNGISVVAAASVGVVNRALSIVFVIPLAIGSAVAAMTAQNLGAAKRTRAIGSLRWGIQYSVMINFCVFLFCMFRPEFVTSLFAADSAVIEVAASYLRGYAFEMVLVSFVFCMNSYLCGCGKSNVAMIHTLISVFCLRVPLSVLAAQLRGITLNTRLLYLGIAGLIPSFFSIVVCAVYIFLKHRKQLRLDTAG